MTRLVSLQPYRTFLKIVLIPRFQKQIHFAGQTTLQNRLSPSESEDCLIFSKNYLGKRSQTLVGKSMKSSITFENSQAKFGGPLCIL